MYQVATVLGIVVAYFVDFALAGAEAWRVMLALSAVPSLLVVALLVRLPDTARWYLMKGRSEEARAALRVTDPEADIDGELDEIEQDLEAQSGGSLREMLRKPYLRATLFVLGLGFLIQITGINAVVFYSPLIFKEMGFAGNAALLLLPALVQVGSLVATVVSLSIVDRLGRRPTLLTVPHAAAASGAAVVDAASCVIALDLGGTALKAGLVDPAGTTMLARHRPARREHGPDAVVAGLLDAVDEMRAAATRAGLVPAAVGLVVPEPAAHLPAPPGPAPCRARRPGRPARRGAHGVGASTGANRLVTVLANARVVTPSRVLGPGWPRIEDGRIAALGAGDPPPAAPLDLGGAWVLPGFVDIHVHGGGAAYTSGGPDEARAAAAFHRAHGTTTTLSSLVTAGVEDLERPVRALAPLVGERVLAGLHLEGPYVSPSHAGAALGAGGEDLLVLVEEQAARRAGRHAGLYHFALLMPSRDELARALQRLAVTRTLADHPRVAGSASGLLGVLQFAVGAATAPLVGVAGTGTALPMEAMTAALGSGGLLAATALAARPAATPLSPVPA
jgi:MFS family permease